MTKNIESRKSDFDQKFYEKANKYERKLHEKNFTSSALRDHVEQLDPKELQVAARIPQIEHLENIPSLFWKSLWNWRKWGKRDQNISVKIRNMISFLSGDR